MGERTRSRIGTTEGVKTVRVYSANPKTADGYNTFIFRRDVARSLNKLEWAPVYDQRVVAKFKADSEVTSLHGQTQIGESAFEQVCDNRFRLILQGVEMYYNAPSSIQTISTPARRQSPKLSVNIPVYNAASFLPRCLDSVLESVRHLRGVRGAGCEVEIVCVDDGSTDGSGAILDEYARRQSNNQTISNQTILKVLHLQNGGAAHARETALRASTGDWIASVDPDDWVEADYLANLLRVAESSDADLIWCDYRTDYEDGRPSEVSHECAGDDLDAYFLGVLGGAHSGVQWNKLIRRAFVMQHDIHYPDGRIPVCEDLWFTAALLNCRPRIRFAPHADYHYCIRPGSATQTLYTHERFVGFARVQEFLEGLVLPDGASRILKWRRRGIKFGAYRHPVVSDEEFHRLYPEVRDLWDFDTPIWHKVLFWLAVRGFKPLINRLWK